MSESLAYLAGVLDSDGFITIRKHNGNRDFPTSMTFSEAVGVGQTSPDAVALFWERWGGSFKLREHKHPDGADWRPMYCWVAANKKAERCIRDIRPWLLVKARQADLVLALRASKALPQGETRTVPCGIRSRALDPAIVALRESYFAAIRRLNDSRLRV